MDKGDLLSYREWLDHAPTPSLICGPEGLVQLANQALFHKLGLVPERVSGGQLRLQELIEGAAPLLEELQVRGRVRRREVQVRDAADTPIDMILSGRRLERHGGYEITLTDISRQKTREHLYRRKLAQLQAMVENLPVGLLLVDRQGHVESLNPGLCNMLQIEPEAFLDGAYSSLLSRLEQRAMEPEVTRRALSRAIAAVGQRPTVEVALAGERDSYLRIDFFPMWDEQGGKQGWGAVLTEIAEEQDEVSWKLELLSILARKLHIPLMGLKEQTSDLLKAADPLSIEKAGGFIQSMDSSMDELLSQAERALSLVRLELGRIQLQPEAVSPSALVHRALERAASALGDRAISLDLPPSLPQVRVDPALVDEVLFNLLDNAARYAPPSSVITVAAVGRGPMVELSVANMGPGVPSDLQARIFEEYRWSDSEGEGRGFSLFISRRIVEAHGGRMWVESPLTDIDHGARFAFTLPRMPQSTVPASRRPRRASGPIHSGQQVGIIEEDPELLAQLRTLLTDAGYQAVVMPADIDAQEMEGSSLPDLVLLDHDVSGRKGLALCRALRRRSSLPILVLVSLTSQDDLLGVLEAGADDYVLKPFQHAELLARIRALMRRGEIPEPTPDDHMLHIDGLRIDFDSRQVWRNDKAIALTPTEYDLLAYLARHRGQVLTHAQLVDQVWEPGEGSRHSLFVHISRLRKKLETDPNRPRLLVTRWGVGYIFKPRR